MAITPSAPYSLTVRIEIRNRPGMLGEVASGPSAKRAVTSGDEDRRRAGIASIVGRNERHEEYVISSVFNERAIPAVAREMIKVAHRTGVARRRRGSSSPD